MNFLIISLPALKMLGFVVALMYVEAFTRPLWMCRHPEIQARYTTAVFLCLISIVYVVWFWVIYILDNYELLSKTNYRDFLCPYTFWCSRLHPCVGFSRRTLHARGEVKIERTTPGLDEVPVFRTPDSEVECPGLNGSESSSGNTPESSDRTSQAHTLVHSNSSQAGTAVNSNSNSNSSRGSTPSPPPRVLAPVPVRPVNFQEVERRVAEAEATYLRNMASSTPDS
ncbi:hypothetical protein PG988_003425 [Apiospora saccharicola]